MRTAEVRLIRYPIRFSVERHNFGRNLLLNIYSPRDNDTTDVATAITFVNVPNDSGAVEPVEPLLRLRPHDAQELMDELWRCGLRPTEGTGSAGSLAATERHLKDMQRIAMGLLRLEGDVP